MHFFKYHRIIIWNYLCLISGLQDHSEERFLLSMNTFHNIIMVETTPPYSNMWVKHQYVCYLHCQRSAECTHVNIMKVDGKMDCRLMAGNPYEGILTARDGSLYSRYAHAICETNPCKNKGVCVPGADHSKFFCKCGEDFEGKFCEKPVPKCNWKTGAVVSSIIYSSEISTSRQCLSFCFNERSTTDDEKVYFAMHLGSMCWCMRYSAEIHQSPVYICAVNDLYYN